MGAELIAAATGLGYLIQDASEMSRSDRMLVGILTIAFLGIVADLLFGLLATHLAPWANRRQKEGSSRSRSFEISI